MHDLGRLFNPAVHSVGFCDGMERSEQPPIRRGSAWCLSDDHGLFRNGLRELLEERGGRRGGRSCRRRNGGRGGARPRAGCRRDGHRHAGHVRGSRRRCEVRAAAPSAKAIMLTVSADELTSRARSSRERAATSSRTPRWRRSWRVSAPRRRGTRSCRRGLLQASSSARERTPPPPCPTQPKRS